MSKIVKLSLGLAGLSALVLLFAFPTLHRNYVRSHYPLSLSLAKEIGIAIKLYSDDHGDRMPPSLAALVPKYIPDPHYLEHMSFLTPNSTFAQLDSRAIILRHSRPERTDGMIVVRADLSGEVIHP